MGGCRSRTAVTIIQQQRPVVIEVKQDEILVDMGDRPAVNIVFATVSVAPVDAAVSVADKTTVAVCPQTISTDAALTSALSELVLDAPSSTPRYPSDSSAYTNSRIMILPTTTCKPGATPLMLPLDTVIRALVRRLEEAFLQGPLVHYDLGDVSGAKVHSHTLMFQSRAIPAMSIYDYMRRICKYTGVSGESLLMSVMHIARFYTTTPSFPINHLTLHRVVLVSLLVTAKFFDDSHRNNITWAKVGGVSTAELNALEIEWLLLIGFNLSLSEQEYRRCVKQLLHDVPELAAV